MIEIIDPACGSGAFLIQANNTLALELARIRTGHEYPDDHDLRIARRDVLRHCIYGVDLNPTAVELCKVSLWINACVPDQPLSFLDHHLRCGNSLLGTMPDTDLSVIPDDAYQPVEGDDPALARAFRHRNRQDRETAGQYTLPYDGDAPGRLQSLDLASHPEQTPEDVLALQHAYHDWRESPATREARTAANLWTAAFFAQLDDAHRELVPTTKTIRDYLAAPKAAHGELIGYAEQLAADHKFFHWGLEFPEVMRERGGFDVVLGNPPWEQVQFDPQEYFAESHPQIADAPNMAVRNRLVAAMKEDEPHTWLAMQKAIGRVKAFQSYVHQSGRYPLTSYGRLNLAPLFAELATHLYRNDGQASVIVPSGIATDSFNQYYFAAITRDGRLVAFDDFENREGIFPGVHSRMKFCLLSLGQTPPEGARFSFFNTRTDHIFQPRRAVYLTAADLALFNPNTRTAPIFRTDADAVVSRAIYRRVPVLDNEQNGANPWGFRGQLMFMMNTDSWLFADTPAPDNLPLYEAKMMHQFDHRFGSYARHHGDGTSLPRTAPEEYADPYWTVTPRYYVPTAAVNERLGDWSRNWLMGWRDITNASNERTAIFSILPRVGIAHTCLLCHPMQSPSVGHVAALLGCGNSLVLDYVARQKMGGTHLQFFTMKQLPILPPATYTPELLQHIVPRVLELTYTAYDVAGFAQDIWDEADDALRAAIARQYRAAGLPEPEEDTTLRPFAFDPDRRARLRAELDAIYARLYGLTRKQLRYILDPHGLSRAELADLLDPTEDPTCTGPHALPEHPDETFPGETFRVLKNNEMNQYGEYRTRRLILQIFNKIT